MANTAALNETFNSSNLPCQLFLGEVLSWESATSLIKTSKVVAITVNLITAPFTLIFNAFVFLTVFRKQLLRKERLVVLACFACTDFFSGLICQPLYIAKEIYFLKTTRPNCVLEKAFYLCAYVTLSASLPQLLMVTYERYVAITKPYKYPRRITNRRLICATVFIWAQVTLETVIYYNYPFSETGLMFVNFVGLFLALIMLAFIIYCHVTIVFVVRRHRVQIERQQRDVAINTLPNDQRVKFQKKSSMSVVILIVLLITSYFPLYVCYGLLNGYGDEFRQQTLFFVLPLVETLTLLNSFLNPIIYCLRTSEFKQKIMKCFGLSVNKVHPGSTTMELSA